MNKWLTWQPGEKTLSETPQSEPSKITKADSDGFDGYPQGNIQELAVAPAQEADAPANVPPGVGEPELSGNLSGHTPTKPAEIPRLPSGRPVTCSATCYEVEPGKVIHHPWDGCRTSSKTAPRESSPED
jgi:hypothetical protein